MPQISGKLLRRRKLIVSVENSMRSKIITSSGVDELTDSIREARREFNPSLAVVFASVRQNIEILQKRLADTSLSVFGCSSSGEIAGSNGSASISEGEIVCLLMEITNNVYSTARFDKSELTDYSLGMKIGEWGKSRQEKPAFLLLSAGISTNGDELVKGVTHITGKETPLYGGLAGDDGKFEQTFAFTEEGITADGAAVIVFDSNMVSFEGIASSGWNGVGTEKTISDASGNIVYSIDGKPALDVFSDYLGLDAEALRDVIVDYPLLVKREDGTEVLRAVMDIDIDKRSLLTAGTVERGAKFKFSSSGGLSVIQTAKDDIAILKQNVPESDALIAFSCIARYRALGPLITEELNEVSRLWNSPLVGFFTYGEIGKNKIQHCDFFNETLNLVTMRMNTKLE